MKRWVVILYFGVLWVAALATFHPSLAVEGLKDAIKFHRVISRRDATLELPGLNPTKADRALTQASDFAKHLHEAGIRLRLTLDLLPAWLHLVDDPFSPGHRQIVLREEIADEFQNDGSVEVYRRIASEIARHAREFEERHHAKVLVLIVPTKIAANRLQIEFKDVAGPDLHKLKLKAGDRKAGGLANQEMLEAELRRVGAGLVQTVDIYRSEQRERQLLYPRGESHWAAEIMIKVLKAVGAEVGSLLHSTKSCFGDVSKRLIAKDAPTEVFGDLAEALGWRGSLSEAWRVSSQVLGYDVALDLGVSENAESCPTLALAGSSYSVVKVAGLSGGEVLRAMYWGNVQDVSALGVWPLDSLRKAERAGLPKGSIVIWEFPFRYAKHF